MNEKLKQYFVKGMNYWKSRTKKQKTIFLSSLALLVILAGVITFFATRTKMEPLYSNLSPEEIGSIKQELDHRGVKYQVTDGGTTIMVPSDSVDSLKVDLAAQGLPKTGQIDYSFFGQNAKFGMTDNEFNVLKLDAMQTELANLIKSIDGVKDAKVMINLPEKGVFVSDNNQEASASIVLETEPGYQFDNKQIKALYHLVSKSVPNLPEENIAIMDQNFQYYDLQNNDDTSGNEFAQQWNVRKQIERDIQQQVQMMLGTLMGQDKVVVSVTADIDFTKEKRDEKLVEPVDKENMKGIEISAQRISDTYTGTNPAQGGSPQSQNQADTVGSTYAQGGQTGSGDSEHKEETINYEINRIHRHIVESPYKIRDLGIQVLVEPPKANDPASLPQSRVDDIKKILSTVVSTSIDKSTGTQLTNNDIQNKIAVSVQPFYGKVKFNDQKQPLLPWWAYLIGAILLLIIGLLVFFLIRSRMAREEELEELEDELLESELAAKKQENEEEETELSTRRKQIEKMAKEKPEEFAKLIRTWLSED